MTHPKVGDPATEVPIFPALLADFRTTPPVFYPVVRPFPTAAANDDFEIGAKKLSSIFGSITPRLAGGIAFLLANLIPSNLFIHGSERDWENHRLFFYNLNRLSFQDRVLVDFAADKFPWARQKIDGAIQKNSPRLLAEVLDETKKMPDLHFLQWEAERRLINLSQNGDTTSPPESYLWGLALRYGIDPRSLFDVPANKTPLTTVPHANAGTASIPAVRLLRQFASQWGLNDKQQKFFRKVCRDIPPEALKNILQALSSNGPQRTLAIFLEAVAQGAISEEILSSAFSNLGDSQESKTDRSNPNNHSIERVTQLLEAAIAGKVTIARVNMNRPPARSRRVSLVGHLVRIADTSDDRPVFLWEYTPLDPGGIGEDSILDPEDFQRAMRVSAAILGKSVVIVSLCLVGYKADYVRELSESFYRTNPNGVLIIKSSNKYEVVTGPKYKDLARSALFLRLHPRLATGTDIARIGFHSQGQGEIDTKSPEWKALASIRDYGSTARIRLKASEQLKALSAVRRSTRNAPAVLGVKEM